MDQELRHPFNGRGFVSVTSGLTFLGLVVTGFVLFFTPPGRYANWNDWRLWGLTKQQWNGLHIWFSVLFCFAALFHIYYNWKCLIGYFKDKARRHLSLRWEWGLALLLVWIMTVGTVRGIVPFSSFLNWHTAVKHRYDNQPSATDGSRQRSHSGGYGYRGGRRRTGGDTNGVSPEMTLWDIPNAAQSHPGQIRGLLEP